MIIDGVSLKKRKFDDILDEQTTIALLSKGAISLSETNNMPASDRRRILKNLMDIEHQRQESIKQIQKGRIVNQPVKR
nr:MAG TPA: hypothetical protein [Bacteriophage sp.]